MARPRHNWRFWADVFEKCNVNRWVDWIAWLTLPCAPNYRPKKGANDNVKRH